MSTPLWGVVANYDGDNSLRAGAKCWVARNTCDTDRQNVWARSRGGRWIEKYVANWRLNDFRAKWLPPVAHTHRPEWYSEDRAEAETFARRLDRSAQEARARRNVCDISRMAGCMDEHGRRASPSPSPETPK